MITGNRAVVGGVAGTPGSGQVSFTGPTGAGTQVADTAGKRPARGSSEPGTDGAHRRRFAVRGALKSFLDSPA